MIVDQTSATTSVFGGLLPSQRTRQPVFCALDRLLQLRQALARLVAMQPHVQLETLAVIVDLRLDLREATGPLGALMCSTLLLMPALPPPPEHVRAKAEGDKTQGDETKQPVPV